jgi:hypothetical protein
MCGLHAAEISEVWATRVVGQVPAFSQYGRIQLSAAEALVNVPETSQVPANMDLIVVFDPATGRFLWWGRSLSPRYPPALSLIGGVQGTACDAIYSAKGSLTLWQAPLMPAAVLTSTSSAFDLSEAFDRALSELKAGWEQYYSRGKLPNLQKVDLLQLEQSERRSFLDPADMSARASAPPAIEDVSQIEDGFKIRMRANWTGEVIVGADMTIKERFHRVAEK